MPRIYSLRVGSFAFAFAVARLPHTRRKGLGVGGMWASVLCLLLSSCSDHYICADVKGDRVAYPCEVVDSDHCLYVDNGVSYEASLSATCSDCTPDHCVLFSSE